ncbi:MAG: amidohydrolase family protein [Streptosporangiales bacterium]|nr:amidohydrolase family protein [Streptosporangiales bacterium]
MTTSPELRRAEAMILKTEPRRGLLANAAKEAKARGLYDIPIVDVDCHIIETMNMAELIPFIKNPAIKHLYSKVPSMANMDLAGSYGDRDAGGRIFRDTPIPGTRGAPSVEGLLDDMRVIGIDYASIFPTPMLALGEHPDIEVEVAVAQAYNRWLVENYLGHDPRVKALLYLPFNDPEASYQEVVELGDKPGVVGFMVTSVRKTPIYHNSYMKTYAALQERGLPIGFHSGPNWHAASASAQLNRFMSVHALDFPLYNILHLFNVVVNGLPERFPRLKWVFFEAGIFWLAFAIQRLDHEFLMRPSEAPLLKRRPSEYIKEMFFATQPLEYPEKMEYLEMVFDMVDGESQLLYASDYPHWDFDLPSRIYDLPFLSDQGRKQVLGENAMRLFDLPQPAMLDVAEVES